MQFKKLYPDAKAPTKKYPTDAGWDLYAHSMKITEKYIEYGTGIAIDLNTVIRKPDQLVWADLRPRSSISDYNLIMCNAPGTVDLDYTGELKFRFKVTHTYIHLMQENSESPGSNKHLAELRKLFKTNLVHDIREEYYLELLNIYKVGDKIGQLVICSGPNVLALTEVEEFTKQEDQIPSRGSQGFGSTGK